MWVQGHQSIFANVEGRLTVRGFRGNLAWYLGESLPGPAGEWFSKQLNAGVPGSFVNDMAFTKFPGKQTVIYVPVDADTAAAFRDELNATKFDEPYKYSPPRPDAKPGGKEWRMRQFLIARGGEPMAVICGNQCVTVPAALAESAIGIRPGVATPGGMLDITTGRTAGGPVDPHEKGRASRMREWLEAPDLSSAKPGATRIGMTKGATRALGVIRIGGGIWMVYGGISTMSRLRDAWGTEDFPQALAEEAGAWGGGIAGAELGSAIASSIGESVLLVTGGEVSALFIVGGFGVALGLGYLGATVGANLVRGMFEAPQLMVEGTAMALGGFMEANELAGKFVRGALVDIMLRPVVEARAQINPRNWDLRNLPPETATAVRSLGQAAWSGLARMNEDELLGQLGKTYADLGIAGQLAKDVARTLVPAGVLITGDAILASRPAAFVQYLHRAGVLNYVRDPKALADMDLEPGGHKVDEADLNVRLLPLVETRARINPNNWDLRPLGPGTGDARRLGEQYWRRLSPLERADFDRDRFKTLSELGVPWSLMQSAARAILRSRDFGLNPMPGEPVPPEQIDEFAQGMLSGTPEDYVRQLEQAGVQYRRPPASIAEAAKLWVRAGYQPW